MPRTRAFPLILLVACAALPVRAQQTVIQIENVRTEYARVLRAEPVYQTLRATAMAEECEDAAPADGGEPRRGLAKVVGAVKDALTPNSDAAEPEAGEPPWEGCDVVPTYRKSVVSGKSGSVRVALGVRRFVTKINPTKQY